MGIVSSSLTERCTFVPPFNVLTRSQGERTQRRAIEEPESRRLFFFTLRMSRHS